MNISQKKVVFLSITIGLFLLNSCSKNTDNQPDKDSLATVQPDSLSQDSMALDSAQNVVFLWDSIYSPFPKNVLSAIMQGNARHNTDSTVLNQFYPKIPDSLARRKPLLVITDIDMNRSVENVFDLRQSMIFQIGSPACLIDSYQVAAIEYAVLHSKTKVILVLANSTSRIVGAACDNVKTGNFEFIKKELAKSMESALALAGKSSENQSLVRTVAENQALNSQNYILTKSPLIMQLVKEGKIILKSASYDAMSESVTILEPTRNVTESSK